MAHSLARAEAEHRTCGEHKKADRAEGLAIKARPEGRSDRHGYEQQADATWTRGGISPVSLGGLSVWRDGAGSPAMPSGSRIAGLVGFNMDRAGAKLLA